MSWDNVVLTRIEAERLLAAAHALATIRRFEDEPQIAPLIQRCNSKLTIIRAQMEDQAPGDLLRYATDLLAASTLSELEGLDRFETAALTRCCRWWGNRGAARVMDKSLR